MREINSDGSPTDPDRDAWMLGFESGYGDLVCSQCGAKVPLTATHASRHREWHVRNG